MPSASVEPVPLKLMLTGAWPDVADAVKDETGAWLAAMVMVLVVVPVAPWLSVTVRRAV